MIDPITVTTIAQGLQLATRAGMSVAHIVAMMKAGITWEQAIAACQEFKKAAEDHLAQNDLNPQEEAEYQRILRERATQTDVEVLPNK